MQIYFNTHPQVERNRQDNLEQETDIATNLATISSVRGQMTVQTETFDDDSNLILDIADVEPEIITVLYSAESTAGHEKGIVVVAQTGTGYKAHVQRFSDDAFMEFLAFSATWDGSVLKLTITGTGSGASTNLRWRTSPFNSLDILPAV